MSIIKEFREFAVKGNVIDMAVGVVIGGAFGKIVSSFVSDVIMPPLNLLTMKYGMNFRDLALKAEVELPKMKDGKPELDAAGNAITSLQNYTLLNYGMFIQTIVDFTIVALAIFLFVKAINTAKKRFEAEKAAAPPAVTPEDIQLLREIRDELRSR